MAKPRAKSEFRSKLSEKLMDLGNFAAVALVIGQFVGGVEFSPVRFALGALFMVACYILSYLIIR